MKLYLLVESADYESGFAVSGAFRSKQKADKALKNFSHGANSYFTRVDLEEVDVDMEEDASDNP